MKRKIKLFLIPFMLLATMFLATACSEDPTAYDNNDANGYTVSVKYDANGGVFTGTSGIMVDSFNISQMEKDASGMVNLKLLDPTNDARGDWDAANGNMALAGWYRERTEGTDSEGKTVYTYSGKFNFDTDVVTVDPSKSYTSAEPVLTLYALWIPRYEIHFLDKNTGEPVGKVFDFDPMKDIEIQVPDWNTETGKMDMFNFPVLPGKTFVAAYYDKEGTQPVTDKVDHKGEFIESTGEVKNAVLELYVEYTEGNWYHIYNAEQLSEIADPTGHYVLHADLDFSSEEASWPSNFVHTEFLGSIEGNGHTIKNVSIKQTNNNKSTTGLFGSLVAGVKISNVTFENITVSIEAGTRTPGAAFGLFAGNVNPGVELENIKILNSKLLISSKCFWGTSDFAIGLLCGIGSFADGNGLADIDYSGITCEATGDDPLTITVDGNTVTIAVG